MGRQRTQRQAYLAILRQMVLLDHDCIVLHHVLCIMYISCVLVLTGPVYCKALKAKL